MRRPGTCEAAIACGILLTCVAAGARRARADENYFGYSYGSETLPKGAFEAYSWTTWRTSKGQGSYNALDLKQEIEYGITDRLQASFYLNERYHSIDGAAPFEEVDGVETPEYPDRNQFAFQGVQASLKYNVLSPFKDPLGFAVYVEPGWSRVFKISGQKQNEWSLEFKGIFQKNFLDDQLIAVLNISPELEVRKFIGSPTWETELALEFTGGLIYRVAPKWFAGVEMRYHSEYPDFVHELKREHWAMFAGPVVHYGAEKWWFTFTVLPQFYGEPHDDARSKILHLEEHEKVEVRLKTGINF